LKYLLELAMKKYVLQLLFVIFISNIVSFAQTYLGYTVMPQLSGGYHGAEIFSGGNLSTATGDDGAENISFPFPIHYMGQTYNNGRISVNGWLEMGQAYTGTGSLNELGSTIKKNLICPLWDDLYADSLSEIRYGVKGEAPARIFIVQWKNIRFANSQYRKTFQLRIWEFDKTIDFIYPADSNNYTIPNSCSVGMNNTIGGAGNFISIMPALYPNSPHVSDSVAYDTISYPSILTDAMFTFLPENNINTKLYQTTDTLLKGAENQKIIGILIACHMGPVLTSPWVTSLSFNTAGTTNTSDILNARIFYTGASPIFSTASQLGSTVLNPAGDFSIPFFKYLNNEEMTYFWLTYSISPDATTGNYIDATNVRIQGETGWPAWVPDSSMAAGRCVVGAFTPVELSGFYAHANGCNVELKWETATESNNSGFEIERSISNNTNATSWVTLKFIKGAGTSSNVNKYTYIDENLNSGCYQYRLKQIDYNGAAKYYELENRVTVSGPAGYALSQNYPNPFNPATTIKYSVARAGKVTLKIFDILGKEIATLVNEQKEPGQYYYEFDGSKFDTGVYFYTLKAGDFLQTKKMIIIK
jgi:hypothetical protein